MTTRTTTKLKRSDDGGDRQTAAARQVRQAVNAKRAGIQTGWTAHMARRPPQQHTTMRAAFADVPHLEMKAARAAAAGADRVFFAVNLAGIAASQ